MPTSIYKNFTLNSIFVFLGNGLGLLNYGIFLYFESLEELGIWSTIAIIIGLSQFIEYGLTDGLFRKVAIIKREGTSVTLPSVATSSAILFLVIGVTLSFFLYLAENHYFALVEFPETRIADGRNLYRGACLVVIFSACSSCLRAILLGLDAHLSSNFLVLLGRGFQSLILTGFVVVGFGVYSQLYSILVFYIFVTFSSLILLYRSLATMHGNWFPKGSIVLSIFKFSREMFVFKAGQKVFVDEGIKVVIARFYGVEAVGAFATAFSLSQMYRNIVDSGSKRFLNYAISYNGRDLAAMVRKIQRKIIFPVSILVLTVVYFIPNIIGSLRLNNDIALIHTNLLPIVIGYSFNLYVTPLYYILLGKGAFRVILLIVPLSIFSLYFSFFAFREFDFYWTGMSSYAMSYMVMLIATSLFLQTYSKRYF